VAFPDSSRDIPPQDQIDFEEWGIDTSPAGTRPFATSFFLQKKLVRYNELLV
jgi:hypothetical protein